MLTDEKVKEIAAGGAKVTPSNAQSLAVEVLESRQSKPFTPEQIAVMMAHRVPGLNTEDITQDIREGKWHHVAATIVRVAKVKVLAPETSDIEVEVQGKVWYVRFALNGSEIPRSATHGWWVRREDITEWRFYCDWDCFGPWDFKSGLVTDDFEGSVLLCLWEKST